MRRITINTATCIKRRFFTYRFFSESCQSLVRPWALILGGRLYGTNIWVEYYRYLYLSPYTIRPTLYRTEFE